MIWITTTVAAYGIMGVIWLMTSLIFQLDASHSLVIIQADPCHPTYPHCLVSLCRYRHVDLPVPRRHRLCRADRDDNVPADALAPCDLKLVYWVEYGGRPVTSSPTWGWRTCTYMPIHLNWLFGFNKEEDMCISHSINFISICLVELYDQDCNSQKCIVWSGFVKS